MHGNGTVVTIGRIYFSDWTKRTKGIKIGQDWTMQAYGL